MMPRKGKTRTLNAESRKGKKTPAVPSTVRSRTWAGDDTEEGGRTYLLYEEKTKRNFVAIWYFSRICSQFVALHEEKKPFTVNPFKGENKKNLDVLASEPVLVSCLHRGDKIGRKKKEETTLSPQFNQGGGGVNGAMYGVSKPKRGVCIGGGEG